MQCSAVVVQCSAVQCRGGAVQCRGSTVQCSGGTVQCRGGAVQYCGSTVRVSALNNLQVGDRDLTSTAYVVCLLFMCIKFRRLTA